MRTVLRVLLEVLRVIAILLQPFMPETMGKLLDQLGVAANARQIADLEPRMVEATPLPPPFGIFPRYVEAAG
jgi:methionyl-tRNA synthetase